MSEPPTDAPSPEALIFRRAPSPTVLVRWRDALVEGGPGPAVARLYHRVLALIALVAWASLGAQVRVLIGRRGLLPIAPFVAQVRAHGVSWWRFPTAFWWDADDTALVAGVWVGAALCALALAGLAPRLCLAATGALYLSYATAGRTFLSFQWDNLLVESCVLAALLPRERRAWWAHFLLRVLLFKLYWESGVAKWQSYLHDWHDGSAMTYYYETAPLPTWLGWYAHHAPAWWHHVESRAAMALELVAPFAIFGPRRVRLAAALALTAFQVINAATANYGFFVPLALALHLFLLDDRDVLAAGARLRRLRRLAAPAPAATPVARPRSLRRAGAVAATVVTALYVGASGVEALSEFGRPRPWLAVFGPAREFYRPFRVINTYHLFGSITRERIEPDFQTTVDGATWTSQDFRHKPGDPRRAPDFVAPHQPRVDFQLWFYGLAAEGPPPPWVVRLLDRLCHDPSAVAGLFARPLPPHPRAVRLAFWRYHFSTAAARRATGAWWSRELLGTTDALSCGE